MRSSKVQKAGATTCAPGEILDKLGKCVPATQGNPGVAPGDTSVGTAIDPGVAPGDTSVGTFGVGTQQGPAPLLAPRPRPPLPPCPPGQVYNRIYRRCVLDCPDGQEYDIRTNTCVKVLKCPPGETFQVKTRSCEPDEQDDTPECPPGMFFNETLGQCVCPPGSVYDKKTGTCIKIGSSVFIPESVNVRICPDGEMLNAKTQKCVPFKVLTETQLSGMSLEELRAYAVTVSTVIGQQTASVKEDQDTQDQFRYLIMKSDSTITGINNDITKDTNIINSSNALYSSILLSNAMNESSIKEYDKKIAFQNEIMVKAKKEITKLQVESDDISATIAASDREFVSAAVYYSSLYFNFQTADTLYQNCMNDISTTSTLLKTAITNEMTSRKQLDATTKILVQKKDELSTLVADGVILQSNLNRYKIEEQDSIRNLHSTTTGIVVLSSYYETAVLNDNYFNALTKQINAQKVYAEAQSNYGLAIDAAEANPADRNLYNIALAARTHERSVKTTLDAATSNVQEKAALVNVAVSKSYDTAIASARSAVDIEIQNVSTFRANVIAATKSLAEYSTLYEQANLDVISSQSVIDKYTTFYTSSVTGSNLLMSKAISTSNDIAPQLAQIAVLDSNIARYGQNYSTSQSSYTGWIKYSTLMMDQLNSSIRNYITFSTMYDSTNTAVIKLTKQQQSTMIAMSNNDANIATYSSIIEEENINILAYSQAIDDSAVIEEKATFQYRETYVRVQKQKLQAKYNAAVLAQVQEASTINGQLAAKRVAYTPVPTNLNVPTVNTAYSNMNSVSDFINSFPTLYQTYDSQTSNLQVLSTSIVVQREKLSFLNRSKTRLIGNPNDGNLQREVNEAQSDYIAQQNIVRQKLAVKKKFMEEVIHIRKKPQMETYIRISEPSELVANETVISSFLIEGYKSAVI